jgi:hypothetical protein
MATNNAVNNIYYPLTGGNFSGLLGFSPTTAGLQGTIAADNAGAGIVGEVIGGAVTYSSRATFNTSNTPQFLIALGLTVGLWEVWGNVTYVPAGSTTISAMSAGIGTSPTVMPSAEFLVGANTSFPAGALQGFEVAGITQTVTSGSTNVYLIANVTFATSTMQICGSISARRRYSV